MKQAGILIALCVLASCKPIEERLTVEASIDSTRCVDPEFPILVVVRNPTSEPVARHQVQLKARRNGYSDVIGMEDFATDKILSAGGIDESCQPKPQGDRVLKEVLKSSGQTWLDPYANLKDSELNIKAEILSASTGVE